uniref:Uncharacterized protein n=1 Tax=Cacopsylla melanoneura TaxID=428564 RepID=A0A8D9FCQ1_9HEMI
MQFFLKQQFIFHYYFCVYWKLLSLSILESRVVIIIILYEEKKNHTLITFYLEMTNPTHGKFQLMYPLRIRTPKTITFPIPLLLAIQSKDWFVDRRPSFLSDVFIFISV